MSGQEHCPIVPMHRKVFVGPQKFVWMCRGLVDLHTAVEVLWRGSEHLGAINDALLHFKNKRNKKFMWGSDANSPVQRYMSNGNELFDNLKRFCRYAGLKDEFHRVTASDTYQNILACLENSYKLTQLDIIKRSIDEAEKQLENETLDAFVEEYPTYRYIASAIVSNKKRKLR